MSPTRHGRLIYADPSGSKQTAFRDSGQEHRLACPTLRQKIRKSEQVEPTFGIADQASSQAEMMMMEQTPLLDLLS